MQEKGMESDPRYAQLLALARNVQQAQHHMSSGFPPDFHNTAPQAPTQQPMNTNLESFTEEQATLQEGFPSQNFSGDQISQLRNQIMAYKLLSHNQPLTDQIKMAIQGKSSRMSNVHQVNQSGIYIYLNTFDEA